MRSTKLTLIHAISLITVISLMLFFNGCEQKQAKIEKLKADYIQAVKDAYENGDVNALDRFYTAEYVHHVPPYPDIVGLAAYKQAITDFRRMFPGLKLVFDSVIMDADASAERFTSTATDAFSGKQITVTGCGMSRWVNGKVVEGWNFKDNLGYLQQAGFKITAPLTTNTFARVTVTQVKPEMIDEVTKIYRDSVVPEAKRQKGFRGIYSLRDSKSGKSLSIAIWDSEADAIANEESGYYKAQVDKFKDFFTAKPIREGYTVTVQE